MAKKKEKPKNIKKVYMVVSSDAADEFFTSFKEAEGYANHRCEETEEEVKIYEIRASWTTYYPDEPMPETSKNNLDSLVN